MALVRCTCIRNGDVGPVTVEDEECPALAVHVATGH